MLESFVILEKNDVDKQLLEFSNRKRIGGKIAIEYPDKYEDMEPVECIDTKTKCCICISEMENPVKNKNCSHTFCFECLQEWNRVESSCPLCKQTFSPTFNRVLLTNSGHRKDKRLKCNLEIKYESTQYKFNERFSFLRNVLLDLSSDIKHILILSHWNCLLPTYEENLRNIIPSILVIRDTIQHHNLKTYSEKSNKVKITITHVKNMHILRSDPTFQMVVLADTNGKVKFFNIFDRYFHHCKKRYLMSINQSIVNIFRKNSNITNAKSILKKYYKFLTN
jgi:hypothetical protein